MVKLRKAATLAPVVLAASLVLTGCGENEVAGEVEEVEQGVEEGVGEVEEEVDE